METKESLLKQKNALKVNSDMVAHWGKKMYRKGGKLIMYCSIDLQF